MSPDDIMVWPDDVWCYRDELDSFTHKSDDYRVLEDGTSELSLSLLLRPAPFNLLSTSIPDASEGDQPND